VTELLRPVDEGTFLRMIRYAVHTGAQRLLLRPGCRPLAQGLGGPRRLRHRQLTGDDTRAIAGHLLGRAVVPARLGEAGCDAAQALGLWLELPGEALVLAELAADRGGLRIALELVPALPEGVAIEVLET